MITRFEATLILNSDKLVYQDGEPNKIYVDNVLVTDFTEIDKKVEELRFAEPMQLLREERNRRLAETDWWAMKEVDGWQMSPQQRVYRKNLRDMPETSPYPMLNENGELTNVDWPEKP